MLMNHIKSKLTQEGKEKKKKEVTPRQQQKHNSNKARDRNTPTTSTDETASKPRSTENKQLFPFSRFS